MWKTVRLFDRCGLKEGISDGFYAVPDRHGVAPPHKAGWARSKVCAGLISNTRCAPPIKRAEAAQTRKGTALGIGSPSRLSIVPRGQAQAADAAR